MSASAPRTPLAVLAAVAVMAAVLSLLSPVASGGPVAPAPVGVHAATFQPPPTPGELSWQSLVAPAAAALPPALALPLLVLALSPHAEPPARAAALHAGPRRPARAPPVSR